MPRYLIERSFQHGWEIPVSNKGVQTCQNIVMNNSEENVTWLHSYVTPDKTKAYCIYEGPNPEAVRKVALKNGLSVDKIFEVKVLDPYFYL